MAVAAVTGAVFLPDTWIAFVPLLKFAGVVLLALIVLLPMFRGTAARWIGLITALFLIPGTLSGVLENAGTVLPRGLDGFPATPVQVLLLILAAALGLAIWNLAVPRVAHQPEPGQPSRGRPARRRPRRVAAAGGVVRASAGSWSSSRVLIALFWLMPPVAADRIRHAYDVIGASTAQLLALAVFVLAIPSLFQEGTLVVLGLLWLSIPIIAALTIDTTPRAEVPEDARREVPEPVKFTHTRGRGA